MKKTYRKKVSTVLEMKFFFKNLPASSRDLGLAALHSGKDQIDPSMNDLNFAHDVILIHDNYRNSITATLSALPIAIEEDGEVGEVKGDASSIGSAGSLAKRQTSRNGDSTSPWNVDGNSGKWGVRWKPELFCSIEKLIIKINYEVCFKNIRTAAIKWKPKPYKF